MSVAMEQRPQQGRPRSKSNFSFKSDHSQQSAGQIKHERKPSDSYKPHLNSSGKADPNAAMNESQPSRWYSARLVFFLSLSADLVPVAAALEKPTLQSLRSFQHTDKYGNPIGMFDYMATWLDERWTDDPQRSPISPIPRARDGSARSTPSVRSKLPSTTNIGGERRLFEAC